MHLMLKVFERTGLLSLCLLLMLPLSDSGQLNQSHLHRQRHHDTHEVDGRLRAKEGRKTIFARLRGENSM